MEGATRRTLIHTDCLGVIVPKIMYQGKEVDAVEVDFKVRREDWNEYQLEDGTELRMRLVVGEVFHIPGEYDKEGKPVYVVKSQNLVISKSPDHLMNQG